MIIYDAECLEERPDIYREGRWWRYTGIVSVCDDGEWYEYEDDHGNVRYYR